MSKIRKNCGFLLIKVNKFSIAVKADLIIFGEIFINQLINERKSCKRVD